MAVAIRLSRIGTKHKPFFRVVAVDSRKKRDGECLENIGTYDAIKGELVRFDAERYDAWIEKGAQPSDTAKKLYRLSKKKAAQVESKPAAKAPVKKAAAPKKEAVKEEASAASTTTSA
jgi:small subunit ribosomal protein S16